MQSFVHFLIVCSVLGFHKGFHEFILDGVVLMDCLSCLKHLALDYELVCGDFLFGRFKEVYRILGLFLLLGFGLKFLYSDHFCSSLVRFLCCLSGKSRNFRIGFCSKNVLGGRLGSSAPFIDKIEMEKIENLNSDSDDEFDAKNNEDDEKEYRDDEDVESDITALRELLRIERQKVNAIAAELAKERAASATAAEEAMAMILRLQNEKSLLEMVWSQHKRLAEEKQIHDQRVIRSLQWLVWQHEFKAEEEEQPATPFSSRRHKSKEEEDECDEAQTSFNGNILDALENVLYSSRDLDCLSP